MRTCRESLQHWSHSRGGQILNLAFLVGVVVLTAVLCAVSIDPVGRRENERELWFYILQGVLDGCVLIEVIFRWAYHGQKYLYRWDSLLDLLILALCIAATVTEHLPHMRGKAIENTFAMSCRVARDVIRILRLIMLMRWLSGSVVDFRQVREEPLQLGAATKAEEGQAEPVAIRPIPWGPTDPSGRGLYYDTPENSASASPHMWRPGGTAWNAVRWQRSDCIGDKSAGAEEAPQWTKGLIASSANSMSDRSDQDSGEALRQTLLPNTAAGGDSARR